jgi:hypothetical protein
MLSTVQFILYFIAIAAAGLSFYYSIRYRRESSVKMRGLYTARMNICMGTMLTVVAVIQLFLFTGSWVRFTVGTLFLLIGLFNLYAGMRNHSRFNSMPS